MSKLAEFKRLEAQLAEQLTALNSLKNDSELKREIEFETKLRALLDEYGLGLKAVINILDPGRTRAPLPVQKGHRRERTVKTYKNPHTNEVVETKGGNNKVLNAWKAEYGAATVKSWVQ
ncbi:MULTISPECIES: histone-like nucleoid-structuring protein, MvaT/MvaU family [unclassified Pseudomonas]|uniref:histone-like nucleoid-structuring protein, MvaT/MvaU family n=1 Tax=unclassified Pseudomonas TaxID=196821 RepID=UPI002457549F|nr:MULTISPECIES: histone-like nucleoid-structuring protein, MvaT/MvaU family [unclassified Pseudomonas]MDH4561223.1 transcriptional regulator [Pseudomonas sp. BN411]MDH4656951.1 transcriptional regulator [Pseudomonas sp. BN606]